MQHLTTIANSPRRQKRFPINFPARLRDGSERSVLAKLVRAALAGIITVLLQAPMAVAVPIAEWTGPWQVNFNEDTNGVAATEAFFGQTGPDGFERLPGTPALAKSSAFSLSLLFRPPRLPPFSLASDAASRVMFQRSFQLRDSPAGWALALHGELEGTLFSIGATGSSGAAAFADARIDTSPSEPDLLTIHIPETQVISPGFANVFKFDDDSELDLQDGIYTVSGSLLTIAISNPQGLDVGSSFSGFFRDGFSVSVSATPNELVRFEPVPEPTPLLLFGSTMAALLVAARWRQRKQS
jgi:hypothetical protein